MSKHRTQVSINFLRHTLQDLNGIAILITNHESNEQKEMAKQLGYSYNTPQQVQKVWYNLCEVIAPPHLTQGLLAIHPDKLQEVLTQLTPELQRRFITSQLFDNEPDFRKITLPQISKG